MKKCKWAVFAALIIGCLMMVVGCSSALSQPTDLALDESASTLTWNSVDGATHYVVSINDKQYVSTGTSYSVAGLTAGEYTVKVKASDAKKNYRDSSWSDPIQFTKEQQSGLVYTLINNNTEYEVTKAGTAKGDVVIEDEYQGKPVTSIAEKAFYSVSGVTSVTIGANVKSIGAQAFANCSNLESVTIPDSVTSIGEYAFQSCRALTTVSVPDSVAVLNAYTFRFCRNLVSVELGSGLTSIGESAFASCDKLAQVVIPDSVTAIGETAFSDCVSLESVDFGAGTVSIGEYAFSGCISLSAIVGGDSLETIGDYAFASCRNMETMILPEKVVSIGTSAFSGCSLLSEVRIPASVTTVGYGAFSGTVLASTSENGLIYADNWVVGYDETLPNIVIFKEGTAGIGVGALSGSTVTEVDLPETVRYINASAFNACKQLTILDIGDGVEVIGRAAFAYCSILGRGYVSLGTRVKTIESYAFLGCSDLGNNTSYTLTIPATVTTIGTYAFKNTWHWTNTTSGVIYIDNWVVGFVESDEIADVTLRDGTVAISNYAFYKCTTLGTITIPDSVESIGMAAFYGCTSLSRVYMDEWTSCLTEIREYTFYKCTGLNQVDIPIEVETIGRSAFYKSGVMVANIPEWVTSIGDYAYYGCEDLIIVSFGEDSQLASIGNYAFGGCTALTEFTVPEGVTSIGDRAFTKCSALHTVSLGSSLTYLGTYVFNGCSALERIALPDTLTSVSDKTFYKCTALTSVTFGSGTETIGDYAFYGCTSLSQITIPATVYGIGNYAFRNCTSLTAIILDGHITYVGDHAFNGSKFVTIYCTVEAPPEGWSARWNSGYRPVIWGSCLSEDGNYVVSFVKGEDNISNITAKNGVSDPVREGYTFAGWEADTEEGSVLYLTSELENVPDGTALRAVWEETVDGTPEEEPQE